MIEPVWSNILTFWFGEQSDGFSPREQQKKWFFSSPALDAEIAQKFGHLVSRALQGNLETWEDDPHGSLAKIILLDQFTRNIYRKTAKAFSGDTLAAAISKKSVQRSGYTFSERQFLYMPLMHSEDIADQELCVSLFQNLQNDVPEQYKASLEPSIKYAQEHWDIISRFGRFPYRNKVLERENTEEEKTFLEGLTDTYGQ